MKIAKYLEKKQKHFFGFILKVSTFQTIYLKSKIETSYRLFQYSHYCLESLRISALTFILCLFQRYVEFCNHYVNGSNRKNVKKYFFLFRIFNIFVENYGLGCPTNTTYLNMKWIKRKYNYKNYKGCIDRLTMAYCKLQDINFPITIKLNASGSVSISKNRIYISKVIKKKCIPDKLI